ncbi:MAG: TerB family tellurite resistance protein [Deltaproteobacteria bacterium]|nr:TerB family tellurite resistance protein [Deltaproteobacteria bacterium]
MLDKLNREDRLQLMRFVCSFAWADLEVTESEREFIVSMVIRLGLDEEEQQQVAQWLEVPPPADDLDPADIPKEHRQLFLDAAKAMILSDGSVGEVEAENLVILDQLLR